MAFFTLLKLDNDFTITHFVDKSQFDYSEISDYYKTVNMYKFSKDFLNNVYLPFLESYSKVLGTNEYYEQVLNVIVNLKMKNLKALPISEDLWYEIDDIQDLNIAELLFSSAEKKFNLLNKRFGGYWRFEDLKDFCYLVNPYFPPNLMVEEIKHSLPRLIGAYPSGEKVQSLLAEKIFNVPKNFIAVGNGAAELIEILAKSLEGEYGLFGPTFEEYIDRFDKITVAVPKTEGFRYSKDDVISLGENKNGVILVNPDNPSGNYISYFDLIEILEAFKKTNKNLILDESFIDFAEDGFASSLLNKENILNFPNLIVIKSIGKSYGVGGLRLGVIASSNRALMQRIKSELPIWNINSVAEFYLQIVGKYKADYEKSCAQVIAARSELFEALKDVNFLEPYPSQGNYIFCKVINKKALEVAVSLNEKFSIIIKDCSSKSNIDDQYIRIAVRNSWDNQYLVKSLKSLM